MKSKKKKKPIKRSGKFKIPKNKTKDLPQKYWRLREKVLHPFPRKHYSLPPHFAESIAPCIRLFFTPKKNKDTLHHLLNGMEPHQVI